MQWVYRHLGFFFTILAIFSLVNTIISQQRLNYGVFTAISLGLAILYSYFFKDISQENFFGKEEQTPLKSQLITLHYAISTISVGTIVFTLCLLYIGLRGRNDPGGNWGGIVIAVFLLFLWAISAILIIIGTIFHFILKRKLKHFRS